jgi:hypothetical protein
MNIVEKVKRLDLPLGKYVVIGSGILEALGIRSAKDIDIAVTPDLYQALRATGAWSEEERYGKIFLGKDDVDINPRLSWADYPTSTEEAIVSATIIGGIPFMNLDELKRFKLALGKEKDKADVALIEEYQRRKYA